MGLPSFAEPVLLINSIYENTDFTRLLFSFMLSYSMKFGKKKSSLLRTLLIVISSHFSFYYSIHYFLHFANFFTYLHIDNLIKDFTPPAIIPYNIDIYLRKGVIYMEIDYMSENASEMINKLSRQLEHSRDLNDLFITFVDIDSLNIPEEVKFLIKTKIQVCKDDKES